MSADQQTRNRKSRKPHSDFRRLSSSFMSGLLRSLFFINKPDQAGFVLPTTVLLLLMVTLTVGAMSFRTFSRTEQTIAYREQQIVDALAAPAIDRAKAKIEYLFVEDASIADKKPPSSSDLLGALQKPATGLDNSYTFPDETRIDIDSTYPNGDTDEDDAWKFVFDNGTTTTDDDTEIIYSIVLDDAVDPDNDIDTDNSIKIDTDSQEDKAKNLVVRNGPIDTTTPKGSCPVERLAGNGWQLAGAQLAKNVQVNVLVIQNKGKPNETVHASEYQQVRVATQGNKWGAWFRYDLAATPGEPFRWNGAMHTEGNMIANDGFVAYMVSSEGSCIYDNTASAIEVSGTVDSSKDDSTGFLGQLVAGGLADNTFQNGAQFHTNATADKSGGYTNAGDQLKDSNDMIESGATSVADILQDPVKIFTEDKFLHVDDSTWDRDTGKWDEDTEKYGIGRVRNDTTGAQRPFLDDGYRADNRYGPKPVYNDDKTLAGAGKKSGDKIDATETALVSNTASPSGYGLDGYWERNAAAEGLRIIVGQRLELGNAFGWKGGADPLYPADSSFDVPRNSSGTALKGVNESLQMRSLRDNLAAVQSMAVYHYADSTTLGKYPLACIASTSHPGTIETVKQSRTFDKYPNSLAWEIDFFRGKGTNGLEFTPPSIYSGSTTNTYGALKANWSNALKNLAYFAGDPKGGTPSFKADQAQESATAVVHPYPYMSMWGDFSILRRIFEEYGSTDELSIADQSTIHTAACTLGMLAYNVESIKEEFEAIPGIQLSALANRLSSSGPRTTDYWVTDLYNDLRGGFGGFTDDEEAMVKNALVISEYFQIERDRRFGFMPASKVQGLPIASPSSGYSALNRTYTDGAFLLPSSDSVGCDPKIFERSDTTVLELNRIRLARTLCSTVQEPKYPSLYYLLPYVDHDQSGANELSSGGVNHQQPIDLASASTSTHAYEEYFAKGGEKYIYATNNDPTPNSAAGAKIYKAVVPADVKLSSPHVPGDTSWETPSELVDTKAALATNPHRPDFSSFNAPDAAPQTSYAYSTEGVRVPPKEEDKSLSGNIIAIRDGANYKFYKTAALDTAVYNGRELLNVRLMNLDIDLLTKTEVGSSGKSWIPEDTGIVYAFREDAAREDSIVRPYSSSLSSNAVTAWESCDTVAELTKVSGDCKMDLDPRGINLPTKNYPNDPPLNVTTGISPKPVDMYPDPARQAHGFRFINGKSLHRKKVADKSVPAPVGMTFISDNTVYIKGDFNLHAEKPDTFGGKVNENKLIEEFKGTNAAGKSNVLGTAFAKATEADARKLFYGRESKDLDKRFAAPDDDNWRPVEIFADAITILSDTFIDGSAKDYFTVANQEKIGQPIKNSSYLNANRPNIPNGNNTLKSRHSSKAWLHETDPSLASKSSDNTYPVDREETPIVTNRNGQVYKGREINPPFVSFPQNANGTTGYLSFYVKNDKQLYQMKSYQQVSPRRADGGADTAKDEAPVRINALMISGIVPAREGQGYGGIHNFPRFLEYWTKKTANGSSEDSRSLVIAGGFFQLSFSSQAVGPFDQDAWEPDIAPTVGVSNPVKRADGTDTANDAQSIFYYGPPERIWGYDPALQYSPAGPIAQRFIRADRPRSEYYRELPIDDPYIKNLCTQVTGGC